MEMPTYAFGPNDTYYACCFSYVGTAFKKDRPGPWNVAALKQVGKVYHCSFQGETGFYFAYRDAQGVNRWILENGLAQSSSLFSSKKRREDDKAAYGKLSRLISDQSSVSLEQIKIVFGPENSYIATWNHGMLWHNLPRTLATQLRQREDSEAAVPRVVALGSRGTWFAIWGEDDMVYDLKGKYTSMLEMIKVSKPEDIKYVAMDAFADKRYIIFYHDDTFSICTRRVDADSLLRRHDFRRQCQCTLNNTVLRIQKKARVAGSESTAILDFSPLTAEQLVAAGESSMASPLVVPTSELVHLNVEILSEQPKESEISNKLAADENMETTKYFDVDGEKGTSSKAETWREADAETLS